jgi:hypothetical protein
VLGRVRVGSLPDVPESLCEKRAVECGEGRQKRRPAWKTEAFELAGREPVAGHLDACFELEREHLLGAALEGVV